MTLVDLLVQSIERYRNRPALIMRPRYRTLQWSYADLARYAGGIAERLKEEGISPGETVLLWMGNSPHWVGAFFGILLRGGVAVPLHVESLPEFIQKVSLQTGARLLLKSSSFTFRLRALKAIDADLSSFDRDAGRPVLEAPRRGEADLAEILYTSGTTGDPKGVMLTHGNLCAGIEALTEAVPLRSGERFLSILPLSHIFEQVAGMLYPISRGALITYLPRVSSGLIASALKEHRVTMLLAVPQFLDTVMRRIEAQASEEGKTKVLSAARRAAEHSPFFIRRLLFHKIHKRFGGKLRAVACGGAPLDPELEQKWQLLGLRLLQGYGLTETASLVSANTFREHRFGSVGKPLKGVQRRVDADGEILVRGPNVFQGYYKREELYREAFTPEGWFKTGDVGQLDPDGFLFLRGRKKYLILGPGGQNVYPEDIERELNHQPGVLDSAVVGLPKEHRVEIHAVLLLQPGADAKAIVEGANRNLASFQRMQNYSLWPESDFPRSATRKVRKEVLLKWLEEAKKTTPFPLGAASPLTKLLGEVFREDPSQIHPDSALVADLGLDSILRIELVLRIEEAFGVSVEERSITHETRVKDLEHLIREAPPTTRSRGRLKRWPFAPWVSPIRSGLHATLVSSLLSRYVRLEVSGGAGLSHVRGPLLIMPNHRSFLDSAVLYRALPPLIRRRTASAAATDVLKSFRWEVPLLTELLYASFPFPRQEYENIEEGLEAVGRLLDRGWSVMVYPEGRMSEDKQLLPLKRGAGLLAVEMGVPVVPVFLDGTEYVLPRLKVIPRKSGAVRVHFGAPLRFQKTDSYVEATARIEQALRELQERSLRSPRQ